MQKFEAWTRAACGAGRGCSNNGQRHLEHAQERVASRRRQERARLISAFYSREPIGAFRATMSFHGARQAYRTEIDRNSSPHTALRGARPASQFTFTPYVLACGYMCACIVPLSQYSVGNTWHVDEFYVSCPLRQTNRLYHVKDMGFGRSRTPKVRDWLSRGAEYE